MKRLVEQADSSFAQLGQLVSSAEAHAPNPFAKKLVQLRLSRQLAGGETRRRVHPALLALGVGLITASAAAAGYSWLAPGKAAPPAPPVAAVTPAAAKVAAAPAVRALPPQAPAADESEVKPAERRAEKPRAGEDPTQVAEAVRALRKQGDPVRAQALLDQYLRSNPRGALAEDALALSIEAAAARKDPRAAEYARRYLQRYPNGRFRGMAERAASR